MTQDESKVLKDTFFAHDDNRQEVTGEFDKYFAEQVRAYNLHVGDQTQVIKGNVICTGKYEMSVSDINFKSILNLTEFLFPDDGENIWHSDESNIRERVFKFMDERKDRLRDIKYFTIAINKSKKNYYAAKIDLPNVNAALLLWLLKYFDRDVESLDDL